MLFTEREPFVHSGAQSDDSAWNKAGTSFGTKLWQRSHVVGWKSTSSNTRRWLRRVPERNRDLTPTKRRPSLRSPASTAKKTKNSHERSIEQAGSARECFLILVGKPSAEVTIHTTA